MTRRQIFARIATLSVVVVFAACDLNPQPLPPSDEGASPEVDAGAAFGGGADSGRTTNNPPPENPGDAGPGSKDNTDSGSSMDGGSPAPEDGGGLGDLDGGDAGDGGDSGDSGDGGDAI